MFLMKTSLAILTALIVSASSASAAPPELTARQKQLTRDIYKELIEINTTDSVGNTTTASEAMAARLRAAGFAADDVKVLGPDPRKGNLVARLRGSGKQKPLLLLAHLDVVEARREDWSIDPFTFLEKDGFFYGRGTSDDKAMAAIWIANLIRYKEEGFVPNRDLIVALTADEEGGTFNGVDWLIKNHRNLIDAELCLNEGGGGRSKKGKHLYNGVGASEKVYITFRLEATNKGGHSSVPQKTNAIYQIANALTKLEKHTFPVKLNEVTRAYFKRMAQMESGPGAADMKALAESNDAGAARRLSDLPVYNALMRTTCVTTKLEGGHADNALPQMARATVNCRVLPGESTDEVRNTVERLIDDSAITISWIEEAKPSVASPLSASIMKPIASLTNEFWPGVPVLPLMATGASDGLYLRNAGIPTYGVSGLFSEIDDIRAHGRDERMGVQQFYDGTQFLYRLVKKLSS